MPQPWGYEEQPERPRHPPTALARPVPWSPERYSQTEHLKRLTPHLPQEQPPDVRAQPSFTPQAYQRQPRQPRYEQLPPRAPQYQPPPPPQQASPIRKSRAGRITFLVIAVVFFGGIIKLASSPSPAAPSTTSTTSTQTQAAPAQAQTPAGTGPAGTTSEMQALAAAQGYLSDGQGFSRQGLIDQLDSPEGNGFSAADATWAVDHSGANWDDQAVDCAKGYMSDGEGFSREGLIQQMTSAEGNQFTQAQAEYAANAVGL